MKVPSARAAARLLPSGRPPASFFHGLFGARPMQPQGRPSALARLARAAVAYVSTGLSAVAVANHISGNPSLLCAKEIECNSRRSYMDDEGVKASWKRTWKEELNREMSSELKYFNMLRISEKASKLEDNIQMVGEELFSFPDNDPSVSNMGHVAPLFESTNLLAQVKVKGNAFMKSFNEWADGNVARAPLSSWVKTDKAGLANLLPNEDQGWKGVHNLPVSLSSSQNSMDMSLFRKCELNQPSNGVSSQDCSGIPSSSTRHNRFYGKKMSDKAGGVISGNDNQRVEMLGEALCHSQTRARQAEQAAIIAREDKDHILGLLFREASLSHTCRCLVKLLEMENALVWMQLNMMLRCQAHNTSLNPLVAFERLSNNRWNYGMG